VIGTQVPNNNAGHLELLIELTLVLSEAEKNQMDFSAFLAKEDQSSTVMQSSAASSLHPPLTFSCSVLVISTIWTF
jgi:hypothetical protein